MSRWKVETNEKDFFKNRLKEEAELEKLVKKLNAAIAREGRICFIYAHDVARIGELLYRKKVRQYVQDVMQEIREREKARYYSTEFYAAFFKRNGDYESPTFDFAEAKKKYKQREEAEEQK